ncbi:MAG: hypothetical protein JWM87_4291 [Candidatus Eremiobacteraeota bacterium]|nr:hypothetical protein [Candidatus Eremiobacteraeota bacterium]
MRLILFVGAGVSKPSGLPLAAELTKRILEPSHADDEARERERNLLNVIYEYDTHDIKRVGIYPDADGFKASGSIYRAGGSTYEDLFFLCQQISLWNIGLSDNSLTTPFMECIERKAGSLLRGPTVDARLCDLASLGRKACSFIESVVAEELDRAYSRGFDLLFELATAPEMEQLNIVTLNHDTLVEQFLSSNDVSFIDGFGERDGDVRWHDDSVYETAHSRVRLFKLHGSVDWYSFQYAGRARTATLLGRDPATAQDRAGKRLTAGPLTPSFLSGINKALAYQRGIFADIHFRFGELLRQCDRIVMSGYGWGDTVINFQLDTWLDRSRRNTIVLLHQGSQQLRDASLIMASGYDAWVRAGQLIPIEHWLSDLSLTDVRDHVYASPDLRYARNPLR